MARFIAFVFVLLLGGLIGALLSRMPGVDRPVDDIAGQVLPAPSPILTLASGAGVLSQDSLQSIGIETCFDGAAIAAEQPDRSWLVRDIAGTGTQDRSNLQPFPDLADYPGLVKMEHIKSTGGSEREHCGAARIAPDWYLTASHCIKGLGNGTSVAPVDLILVSPSEDLRAEGTIILPVRAAICHSAYRMNLLQWPNDVALLYVPGAWEGADIPVAELEDARRALTLADMGPARIAAWGANGRDRFLQGGPVSISEAGEAMLLTEQIGAIGPDVGDSGSPLFVETDGGLKIVGVLSQVTQGESAGRRGVFVRVKSVLGWIDTVQSVCVQGGAFVCGLPTEPEQPAN